LYAGVQVSSLNLFLSFKLKFTFSYEVNVVASSTATAATSSTTAPTTNLHMYWQSEMAATSAAQNKIISFLKQRNVPIGKLLRFFFVF
jgi:hypothetical protein